ncbi:hypothetical protein FPV67DRAFT_1398580, partial [Lyophyllum atratum]
PTTPPPSSNTLIQFASAFSQLSPNTQIKAMSLINNTSSSLPSVAKVLFSASDERPSSSKTGSGYGIHPFILELARNKIPIPLTLFTSASTNRLHREATSIKQISAYSANGTKTHVMDVSQFPDQNLMDIADWHEAWSRYKTFHTKHSDAAVSARWHAHYDFLAGQDNFRANFAAILKFDIEERVNYTL